MDDTEERRILTSNWPTPDPSVDLGVVTRPYPLEQPFEFPQEVTDDLLSAWTLSPSKGLNGNQ